jgi:hypothetical protein
VVSNLLADLEGAPGPTLVGYAKRTSCDLIVLGHRGLNGFERFFLGSISEYRKNPPFLIEEGGFDVAGTAELKVY